VPVVSVVIPVLDDAIRLQACLDALASQQDAPAFEVVVVDNGSSDASVAVARAHRSAPRLVEEPRPGSYAARNAGAAVAEGARLAFTDADCVPAPDWVARGAAALVDHPVVGGDVRPATSSHPTVWERYDRAVYLRQRDLVEQQGFAATADLWVRREVFDAVGGFDPTLRSSGDLEWGRRAAAAGWITAYDPSVVVLHAPRTTAGATWRLHRRLGAGWSVLAARGQHPGLLQDRGLRLPLGMVVDALATDGPPLRRRQVAHVHALAMSARWVGRLGATCRSG
jgi:glycosyltransferase involved in cell wall biosynthesis